MKIEDSLLERLDSIYLKRLPVRNVRSSRLDQIMWDMLDPLLSEMKLEYFDAIKLLTKYYSFPSLEDIDYNIIKGGILEKLDRIYFDTTADDSSILPKMILTLMGSMPINYGTAMELLNKYYFADMPVDAETENEAQIDTLYLRDLPRLPIGKKVKVKKLIIPLIPKLSSCYFKQYKSLEIDEMIFETDRDEKGILRGVQELANMFNGFFVKKVILPATVRKINGSFYHCPSLKEIIFETDRDKQGNMHGIEEIGGNSFAGSAVEQLTLPATVCRINRSFYHCPSLKEIIFETDRDKQGNMHGIEEIGEYSFDGSAVEQLTLPATVCRINRAFYHCPSLKEIIFETDRDKQGNMHGIEEIGGNSFSRSAVEQLTLPATVCRINESFQNCPFLKEIIFETDRDKQGNMHGIEEIGEYSFDRSAVEQLTLPATLREINGSFQCCPYLKEIIFETDRDKQGNMHGIEKIVGYSFDGSAVEQLTLPATVTVCEINGSFQHAAHL